MNTSEQTSKESTLTSAWQSAMMNNYGTPPLGIVSGHGAYLVDEQGNEYLDLLAGIAVNSLGTNHPAVVKAVTEQVSTLSHVSNLFASPPAVKLAQRLKEKVGDNSARVIFSNSGAEANEAAFKLARLTGRGRILAANHGFHGRTMGSLAMTGQPSKRDIFGPLPGGVEFYPYGDIEYLRQLVEINPTDTAAIILEPIQGETGVVPAPEGFLKDIRALCDEHGILMIVDEVQTGVGRTGSFFAFEKAGIVPDVITMAKGLGAGLPIGACIGVGKAAELFGPGSHGTTFGGNPVSCAAANAVLDVVDEKFIAEVESKGEKFTAEISNLPLVDHVRGQGLLLGVVLKQSVAKAVVAEGLKNGLILNAPSDDVVRIAPPLVITEQDIADATFKLSSIFNTVSQQKFSYT
ncbi:MAG: acetylornithine transaminase [Corynebacterium casei]|uniref:acetylornithine transaminase n=2 Tax=Corynebacterium casei TaxID=160386 RepID=UPI003F914F0F